MKENIGAKVAYLRFINNENSFHHHRYSKEMLQYEYIRSGDPRAAEEAEAMIHSDDMGHLSDDPLRNLLYLCICNITLVTRFAIEGGMEPEQAYNASDLYIRRYDRARSEEEIFAIHREMIQYFTGQVAEAKKSPGSYPAPVTACIDYISSHLHEKIDCTKLAEIAGLNRSYLSVLFRRETGMTITGYITAKRVQAAEEMLRYSDSKLTEISDILNFSSYSHFAATFRKYCGESPMEYRRRYSGHSALTDGTKMPINR